MLTTPVPVWQTGPRAAYVHVPFCVHHCGYCDFTVIAGRDDLISEYLACLEIELRTRLCEPRTVDTLFLGGGTPSYLTPHDLKSLFQLLADWLPLSAGGEFSIECNPDRFSSERMDVLADGGVNRVSLGVQSFQAAHLRTLERTHMPEEVAAVVATLKERGLTNVSIDLIFGVPGQSLDEWNDTLRRTTALQPRHLSAYGLTYEKGTAFWTRREKKTLTPVAEELEREMYALAMLLLPAQGYVQYELSNFAKPGWECRHNQVYWRGEDYYGFGPGAAALVEGFRSTNHRSVTGWLQRLRRGESPIQEQERLDANLRAREAVMLGLRQIVGIDRNAYRDRFGRDIRDLAPAAYERFLDTGLLEESETHLRLTDSGRFLADTVILEFL